MNAVTIININNIEAVKEFVRVANQLPCDISVSTGRFTVDGKSIMGVFSLDLTKDLTVEYCADEIGTEENPFSKWAV